MKKIKNIILPAKALKAAQICVAKNDIRYFLNGICISNNKISSANGHVLFSAELSKFDPSYSGLNIGTLVGEKIVKINKTIPVKAVIARLNQVTDKIGLVEYLDGDNRLVGGDMFELIEGTFPDVEAVLDQKRKTPPKKVGLNSQYVANVHKVFKYLGDQSVPVSMEPYGTNSPVVFTKQADEIGLCTYLVMNIRV